MIIKKILMAAPAFIASGVAVLPVLTCPACWPLYAGLLSALGISFVNYTPFLFPITALICNCCHRAVSMEGTTTQGI